MRQKGSQVGSGNSSRSRLGERGRGWGSSHLKMFIVKGHFEMREPCAKMTPHLMYA
jgi:hypothetical protein